MDAKNLPLVVVLSTGGTIAGRGASTMSLSEYKVGTLLGTELVEAVPEVKQFARVRVEADGAACADAVIDHDRLAERLGELRRHGTGRHVRAAPGGR